MDEVKYVQNGKTSELQLKVDGKDNGWQHQMVAIAACLCTDQLLVVALPGGTRRTWRIVEHDTLASLV